MSGNISGWVDVIISAVSHMYIEVDVGRMVTSGSLGDVMVSTLACVRDA